MKNIINPKKFAYDVSEWYRLNKRDLPFRKTRDPYKIFLSEMMLQQTQVDTVIPYYNRFIKQYPDFQTLANADFSDVLKLWEGLGYYRRAQYLYETAQMIVQDFKGVFPGDLTNIQRLKGVGRYTAGAIHSIAFNQPTPAVDGNVMRVFSRLMANEKDISKTQNIKAVETIVSSIIKYEIPADFTQALMELGALICQKKPKCDVCPVRQHCQAQMEGNPETYPIKSKPKAKQHEHYIVFVFVRDNRILLHKRPGTGLLAHMLECPQIQTKNLDYAIETFEQQSGLKVLNLNHLMTFKHVFTHKVWHLKVYKVSTQSSYDHLTLIDLDKLEHAISKSQLKILETLKSKSTGIVVS